VVGDVKVEDSVRLAIPRPPGHLLREVENGRFVQVQRWHHPSLDNGLAAEIDVLLCDAVRFGRGAQVLPMKPARAVTAGLVRWVALRASDWSGVAPKAVEALHGGAHHLPDARA